MFTKNVPMFLVFCIVAAFWIDQSISFQYNNIGGSPRGCILNVQGGAEDLKETPDLLIVGAGYLGKLIGKYWIQNNPDANVFAETRSSSSHLSLENAGMRPLLRSERQTHPVKFWQNIIFCASPSGNDDYVGELESAINLWDRTGAFVFTSSGGIFAENSGGLVTEVSAVSESPRAQKLVNAEKVVLEAGGTVVRLAGLYDTQRGAHNYWLSKQELDTNPSGIINQIHYEDAAEVTVAALLKGAKGQVYIAADGNPLTRSQICDAALKCSLYEGATKPKFLQPASDNDGKVYDMKRTTEDLSWEPKYSSFSSYMENI